MKTILIDPFAHAKSALADMAKRVSSFDRHEISTLVALGVFG